MSRFKSLKEVSLKKKLFIAFIIIALAVAIVFVVIKFGFPDPDLRRPYELAYEVGADSTTKSRFESAFEFFAEECSDLNEKLDNATLLNLNSFYMARLSVNKTTNRNVDRLLFALSEVQNMNRVDKKIKHLEELKKNVDSTKNEVLAYCENQVMPYQDNEPTKEYPRISDYFSNFAKIFTNYLKSMRDFENYLEEIIKTSTLESVHSNRLTQFSISLNNKRLSQCVDACEKKFINGVECSINSPMFTTQVHRPGTMFELLGSAMNTFAQNKDETIQQIDVVSGYDWLDGWLDVLGTTEEQNYLKEKMDKKTFDDFKKFIQTFFSTRMTFYPVTENQEEANPETEIPSGDDSQTAEVK